MPIEPGNTAPVFETHDYTGKAVRLEDYRGKKLLLAFFRNSACAMCNLRVRQLVTRYPAWSARGLEVLAVFESPAERIAAYGGKRETPFPIIADPLGVLYDLYRVEVSESKVKRTMNHSDTPQMIEEAAAQGFSLLHEEGSNFHRMPAEFLIGPDLLVCESYYSELVYRHLPLEAIDEFAARG